MAGYDILWVMSYFIESPKSNFLSNTISVTKIIAISVATLVSLCSATKSSLDV
jgi:hypothetical protein